MLWSLAAVNHPPHLDTYFGLDFAENVLEHSNKMDNELSLRAVLLELNCTDNIDEVVSLILALEE